MRPRVYVVKPHHSIDDSILDKFLARKIIPVLDVFPDHSIVDTDIDRLLMSDEVKSLPIDLFDIIENALNVLSELLGIDWIAVPRTNRGELLVAQVDRYEHIRYQAHLHVKHYVKVKQYFAIPYSTMNMSLIRAIGSSDNLSQLPNELYSIIQDNKPDAQELREAVIGDNNVSTEPGQSNDDQSVDTEDNDSSPVPHHELSGQQLNSPAHIDNQIITPDSIASISRHTDTVDNIKQLHSSIMELHDYLRVNMRSIAEFHSDECDIAFRGKWHDDSDIELLAYLLKDNRDHSAWVLQKNG